jgi:L-ascorbate metabolism protein UlaG (beta-lactamase superfamily)
MRLITWQDVGPSTILGSSWRGDSPTFCWLGQAGFLIRRGATRLAIDPYLSDSLAAKYRGSHFPHRRMMPPPIAPGEVRPLDFVLCTHAHGDHMDAGTLPALAEANPGCRFVVPRPALNTAAERGAPPDRTIAADAGAEIRLAADVALRAVPSAHEERLRDPRGADHFLGYVLSLGGRVLYHSGDCVPYPGLEEELAGRNIDVAMLPVNGRDDRRRRHGVLGNFTFAEAVRLCREAGIGWLIPCHFGMFDFNTVDPEWLDEQIAGLPPGLECARPRVGEAYELR